MPALLPPEAPVATATIRLSDGSTDEIRLPLDQSDLTQFAAFNAVRFKDLDDLPVVRVDDDLSHPLLARIFDIVRADGSAPLSEVDAAVRAAGWVLDGDSRGQVAAMLSVDAMSRTLGDLAASCLKIAEVVPPPVPTPTQMVRDYLDILARLDMGR